MALQLTVGSRRDLNVYGLIEVIEKHYRTSDGSPVTVTVGTGMNGLPQNTLYLEEIQ